MSTATNRSIVLPATFLLVLATAACGSDDAGDSVAAAETSETACGAVTVSDAHANATDGSMTGSFGIISNDSAEEVTVVSASSSAAGQTELHEVVSEDGEMVMQRKEAGFTVSPGEDHVLEPGADHVMLLDLTSELEPGDEVDITLTLDDGCTTEYTALVKDADGGDEEYHEAEESESHSDADSHSHDESDSEHDGH